MVNFRKLAKFALTGSLAFGLIAAAGSMNAQAAEGAKPKKVEVDFESQTLNVTPDDGKKANCFYVVVEIDSKVKSTDKIEYNMSNGEADTSKPKVIDISGLNYSKDVTFKVYQEDALSDGEVKDTEIEKVVVKAQPKKVTAKFDPKDGTIKVTGSKDLAAEDWEFRTTYNNVWTSGDAFNVEDYTTYGATLIVREAAAADLTAPTDTTKNHLASKEVKVKIPKKANGPKATIDPIKITVKIPAKATWRIVGSKRTDSSKGNRADIWSADNSANKDGWITADSKAVTLSASDINKKIDSKTTTSAQSTAGKLDILKEGVTIEVKMAGTDKKLESKIGSITIPAQGTAPTKAAASANNDFTWEPVINTKTNRVTGLKFKNNNSSQSLQICVEEASKVDVSTPANPAIVADYDPTNVKFITVPSGKEKVIPVATAKDGNYLFVRFIGVKENAKKNIAASLSSALAFDKIEYPDDITKSLNITLAKGGQTGETSITAPAAGSGNKIYYKVEDKEPNFIPLQSTKTSLGLSTELTASGTKTVSGLTAGKYLIAYECDSKDNVIKYGVTKIEESHIKEAPAS